MKTFQTPEEFPIVKTKPRKVMPTSHLKIDYRWCVYLRDKHIYICEYYH